MLNFIPFELFTISIDPDVGVISPVIILNNVDFPAPFIPSKPKHYLLK